MSLFRKPNKKGSSRGQIAIEGIQGDVLLLPGNHYRMILEVSSINFELKSEEEQDALIDIYQGFLNSLACPLQFMVRVREMDMDEYLRGFEDRFAHERGEQSQKQLQDYGEFVRKLVATNRILARRFFVVIPYDGEPNKDIEWVNEQLLLNADIVAKGLGKLGVRTRVLSGLEILDLFYSFYSPGLAKTQPITSQTIQLLKGSNI